jgi:hypothetical protein
MTTTPSHGTPSAGTSGHRIRQGSLERMLGAQASADELLRQLDHEFGWRLEGGAAGTPPSVVYWPVRLQQPNLIHAVQALAAAALSARGMTVLLCLDDLSAGPRPDELRRVLWGDVQRWFRLIDGARLPRVESLESFCEPGRVAARLLDPGKLVRPTHPWAVERDYYRNRTLYELMKTAKAIPDTDADRADPEVVLDGVRTTRADRLLTPPAVWAFLHDVLINVPQVEQVVTLGGEDGRPIWRVWHDVFADPVRHLYNPRIIDRYGQSGLLRCSSFQEVREDLERRLREPNWQAEGNYPHWMVQNALLLSQYLRNRPPLTVAGRLLDSWPAVRIALGSPSERQRAVQAIAREVSALFRGEID